MNSIAKPKFSFAYLVNDYSGRDVDGFWDGLCVEVDIQDSSVCHCVLLGLRRVLDHLDKSGIDPQTTII